jgi:hypothetical protein
LPPVLLVLERLGATWIRWLSQFAKTLVKPPTAVPARAANAEIAETFMTRPRMDTSSSMFDPNSHARLKRCHISLKIEA